jgi:hypothetical protein
MECGSVPTISGWSHATRVPSQIMWADVRSRSQLTLMQITYQCMGSHDAKLCKTVGGGHTLRVDPSAPPSAALRASAHQAYGPSAPGLGSPLGQNDRKGAAGKSTALHVKVICCSAQFLINRRSLARKRPRDSISAHGSIESLVSKSAPKA